jgi:Adenosyl cobinamide kinase/adenosyl cobinamide phosphate guanylyltransferase
MILVTWRITGLSRKCILILGGARSGKSQFAQNLANKLSREVLFVATGEAGDEEMRSRIKEHKKSRPGDWRTLESPIKVGERIQRQIGNADVVLVDCITMLVSNLLVGEGDDKNKERRVITEIDQLIECIDKLEATVIIVSNEVGLGLVPENRLGRLYRGLLGRANQLLARRAEEVYFMVASIPVEVKGKSLKH